MVKALFYYVLHWVAFATKCFAFSLVLFQRGAYEDKLLLSACVMTLISAILLGLACIFGVVKKCRNNTPPIVTVVLVVSAGVATIAEICIFGYVGFKGAYNGLLSAIFAYCMICLLACITLLILIICRPPVVDGPAPSVNEVQVLDHKQISMKRTKDKAESKKSSHRDQ